MKNTLDRLTLKQRLAIIVVIPCAMILASSAVAIRSAAQVLAETRTVAGLSRLGVSIGAAVHELQRERGRSSMYLASKGQQGRSELVEQRAQTDNALAALDRIVAEMSGRALSEGVRRQLIATGQRRQEVPAMRQRILNADIAAPDAIAFYNGLVADHLAAIDQAALVPADGRLVRRLVAYSSFLRAKENAGQERAVLSNTFAADRFLPTFYRTFCSVVANEQASIAMFRTHAQPEEVAAFERTVTGPDVDRAAAWRTLAFSHAESGGFGVKPADWFAAASKRIDLMKTTEDLLSADVVVASSSLARTAASSMYALICVAFVTLVFGVGGAAWIGGMTTRALVTVATGLQDSAHQVATAASQMSDGAQSLSQAVTEQAASLEETSASMEELASMTKTNAASTASAALLAQDVDARVQVSNRALEAMVASMKTIRESSDKVGRIIKTIDEIAFQTNILALNAAVEAARAGEAGLGFAVVADEVRTLAQRSAEAAKDTAALIEDSIVRSNDGASRVEQVAASIADITDLIARFKCDLEQVSLANQQQMGGIGQVTQAIGQMETVTQTNAATAEESAAASEELSAQARNTVEMVRALAVLSGVAATLETPPERVRVSVPPRTPPAPRRDPPARPVPVLVSSTKPRLRLASSRRV